MGSKKNPIWRVVVADQRSPRDGRVIETIGHYNPQTQPSTIRLDRERLAHWIEQGAQPSNTVRKLMRAPDTEPVVPRAATALAEPPAETAEPEAPAEPEVPVAVAEAVPEAETALAGEAAPADSDAS